MPKYSDEVFPAKKVLKLLEKVDRPMSFCTSGQCSMVLPGLSVEGLGDVGLPLTAAEAKRLLKFCIQAPYGKGTKTVVDTKVRKVWELDPEKFTLANPRWTPMVDNVLREVETKLGLEKQKLSAHLYKLLLYEKGGFFLPHRDGEKLDRMVATLVINLPSKHTGGELIVMHSGKIETISMPGAASGLEIDYAAFYADCEHEVKPIKSGYRLCLTYNLVLTKSRTSTAIGAPDFQQATHELANQIVKWSGNPNTPGSDLTKVAILLQHSYTESSLSIENLKGVDQTRAEALFDAAEQADCDAHLALVTLWESGSAEADYSSSRYGRGGYSRWSDEDDDDEDDADGNSSSHIMGEVIESSLSANLWTDRHGHAVDLGAINLDDDEVILEGDWRDRAPSEEEFEGYTGNAGMTLERWYHRAAIVLWPRSCRLSVWCESGTESAISGLAQMIRETEAAKPAVRAEKLETCRQFATEIVATWRMGSTTRGDSRQFIFSLLKALDAPELARTLIEKTMQRDLALLPTKEALKWLAKLDATALTSALRLLLSQASAASLPRDTKLLSDLASIGKTNAKFQTLVSQIAPLLIQAIELHDADDPTAWRSPQWNRVDMIFQIVSSLATIGEPKLLSRYLVWMSQHPRYDLIEVQIPALTKLADLLTPTIKTMPAIANWIQAMVTELESRTKSPPVEPTDWRRNGKLSCNCTDCKKLSAFLEKPDVQLAKFPLAKARRQHLHRMIEQHRCDCTHVTERGGRPESLVCKKTNASYTAASLIHARDQAHLRFIRKLQSK